MATLRLITLLRPSILTNIGNFPQTPLPQFKIICSTHSLRFKRYSISSSTLDFDVSCSPTADEAPPALSAHPWPEWVTFVDRLKAKGYITQNAAVAGAEDEGAVAYTDMKSVKDACLSFARDRFDILNSLSTQHVQTIVDKGCPNLLRKAVNSAKRLRAYVGLDEGDVCSSCNLRGSCDRAYVMLNEPEAAARTVDVVRILLFYALDPLVISGKSKPSDRELVEPSARKLLLELVELGEKPADPDLSKPASITPQRKKQPLDLSDNKSSKNVDMKQGNWVCIKCNFMNFARNERCLKCKTEGPKSERPMRVFPAEVEMKEGDWSCPGCNFMNFARNERCLKCKTEGPKSERPKRVFTGEVEMKKGDWNCPGCSYMNFASNRQCFRCHAPRPPRQLKPGDWECPTCDFWNYSRNTVCKKCNHDRPPVQNNQQPWEKPY